MTGDGRPKTGGASYSGPRSSVFRLLRGKTTTALGLALRACGHNLRTCAPFHFGLALFYDHPGQLGIKRLGFIVIPACSAAPFP